MRTNFPTLIFRIHFNFINFAKPRSLRKAFALARVPGSSGNTRRYDPAALKVAGPGNILTCSIGTKRPGATLEPPLTGRQC